MATGTATEVQRNSGQPLVGRGGIDRLPADRDGLIQVRQLPGAPEPGLSARPEAGQIAGRSGWSAGWRRPPPGRRAMAWSRSACCPVRSNRVHNAFS